ncbi:MAG: helix-turn-helix transcriptional regulator [Candidatus Aminicenantes bacterium]|nr:helix-turn-helix transcriptional regulator [Candidatus Aminicenantes bacterium]
MAHLRLLLIILSFSVGMISITFSIHLSNKHPLAFLRFHNPLFVLLNFVIFIGLLYNYLQLNLIREFSRRTAWITAGFYHFALSLATVFILYLFLALIGLLLKKVWSRRNKYLLFGSFGLLILAQGISSVGGVTIGGRPVYAGFLLSVFLSFFTICLLATRRLAQESKKQIRADRKELLRELSFFLFFVFGSGLVLNVLEILGRLSQASYLVLMSGLVIIVNLAPLVRLKRFIMTIFPSETSPASSSPMWKNLIDEFAITPSEEQIIQLSCAGMSNKEIEERLFLSRNTIKEYVYRIYKKTGVKNRVQLANVFRFPIFARE